MKITKPADATKVFVNQSRDVEIEAYVQGAPAGTIVEWSFDDPPVSLPQGAASVGRDGQPANDNNGRNQNAEEQAGFGEGLSPTATSTTDANSVAKIVFRTSMFGGDNYKIKAKVKDCSTDTMAISPIMTVWRKFTVEVDAMTNNVTGGEYYPFQTGVQAAFNAIFIELEFKDNQTLANQINTRYVSEITDSSCNSAEEESVSGYIRTGSLNNGTTYLTGRDLHVIGIRKFRSTLSRRGSTCGRHSLIECAARTNGQISFTTAHEIGHGLGYSDHPDQNAPNPGIMGTLGNVSITQVPHFNANQAEFFREQATPQYVLPE